MTTFQFRIGGVGPALDRARLCDAALADGKRHGEELPGLDDGQVLGVWPDELETNAVVRLAEAVGDGPTWDVQAATPPVAQKLGERARPQPLDLEIARHLQHLQHVCHRPRLHLRVEEERLPVSRARRTPVRAIAELVSHPGDWQHRTLRSIQPARVLARQSEDEWNLYENRVAARLVDHLLAYLARRLEELRRIREILDASRDHGDQLRSTSFHRAHRISVLWSSTLESKTEKELGSTLARLDAAQHDLQALLDAPLYQRVPRRQGVAHALKATNILVNDLHYRKVAALWRAWVKHGHRPQETHAQRAERRQRDAAAWDRFVFHLVIRAFTSLGWVARENGAGRWIVTRPGSATVIVSVDRHGVVSLQATATLRLLPLCANFAGADGTALTRELEAWDAVEGEVAAVHVLAPADLADVDRATGWAFGQRTVLFPCSPWGIDSEERMARLLNGWLSRAAVPKYPVSIGVPGLPDLPGHWEWLRYQHTHLVALRAPDPHESAEARQWSTERARDLDTKAQQAKQARQATEIAPRKAVDVFQGFLGDLVSPLAGLGVCPVCGDRGVVEPRPGKIADGSDATWWATCACKSEWGLRACKACGNRYRALSAQTGVDLAASATATPARDWPDKVLGRDVWAQPCSTGAEGQFRCPSCGACGSSGCARCEAR